MMLSAFALVIETEKLKVHSPTELLFMVKKLSVKKWVMILTPYFHYNLWDLTRNLSIVKLATMFLIRPAKMSVSTRETYRFSK